MFIEIITIGDEILIGQVVDTNSAWIGKELNKAGFEISRITSVRDREEEIYEAIFSAMNRVDIVLTTGGLGPTKDDITKKILCDYFHTDLVQDEEVLKNVQTLLSHRQIGLLKANVEQALVPRNAKVIMNRIGTAPIMWFEKEQKVLVAMPGVPQEMETAMSEEVIPKLIQHFAPQVILHRTFLVKNYPESLLSEKLTEWEDHLPEEIKLAYLPQQSLIRLRLTARGKSKELLEEKLQYELEKLFLLLKENIIQEEDISLSELTGKALRKKGKTLSIAESCTGGNVAAMITAIPGSSDYFIGSIVAYSNDIKEQWLKVKKETLINYGAVSENTAIEMVKGALDSFNSDYAVATTGIAGPGGGSEEKPVGFVWIAAGNREKIITCKLLSDRGREANILRAANSALLLLYEFLIES